MPCQHFVRGMTICGKPASKAILDCARTEVDPVCNEHAQGEHILGIDGEPFEIVPLDKAKREAAIWRGHERNERARRGRR